MSDRGIKKWNAYKALIEQEDSLLKLRKEKEKVDKPKISMDKAEEINEILVNYHGQKVEIKYWRDGYIYIVNTYIKIDSFNKILKLLDVGKTICFNELTSLKSE